jgi:hypothetical protein
MLLLINIYIYIILNKASCLCSPFWEGAPPGKQQLQAYKKIKSLAKGRKIKGKKREKTHQDKLVSCEVLGNFPILFHGNLFSF